MLNPKKHKISILEILAYILVARFSCTALANIPIFSMGFTFIYGVMFIFLYFVIYETIKKREMICLVCLLIYTAYVVVVTRRQGLFNTMAFNSYIMIFMFFIYLYAKRTKPKIALRISIVTIIGYLFTALYSIPLLLNDPDIVRKSAAAKILEEGSTGVLNFVGNFDTVYGMILLVIILFYLSKENISSFAKKCLTVGTVIGLIFIVMASFGTAIIITFCALAMVLFKKNRVGAIIVTISLVAILIFKKDIGYLISSFANNIVHFDTLQVKLNDISSMLITGESAGTLAGDDGRLARMEWSFNTFLKYPFLGGFGRPGAKIGYHSEIIDQFARFGLLGGGFLVATFVMLLKDTKSRISSANGKTCFIIVLLLYLIIATLDPAMYTQQILPLFIVLPLFDVMAGRTELWQKY